VAPIESSRLKTTRISDVKTKYDGNQSRQSSKRFSHSMKDWDISILSKESSDDKPFEQVQDIDKEKKDD